MTNAKMCPTCGNSYDAENLFCPLDSAPLRSINDGRELVGSVIAGRYLVSERIGVGGMGEVYRAQDVRLQRPVAIKVLHAALTLDLDALARFGREASNASKINNPHVVSVYDFGETEAGLPYLAMEFVSGTSLRALLEREAPLPPNRVARLISQIAKGLDAAHRLENPVIHRDLKPDNILVTEDDTGAELAKVADFGISKAIRDETQQVTKAGFVTGTCEFMSPEQVTGGAPDQRSDVYALGLIAFLMLTGKLPFPGETPEHSMAMRLNEAPRSLRSMCPEVNWPAELQRVMSQALARDPSGRPSSAGSFAAELTAKIEQWQSPSPQQRRTGWARPALWTGATTALLALGAALWALWPDAPAQPGLEQVGIVLPELSDTATGTGSSSAGGPDTSSATEKHDSGAAPGVVPDTSQNEVSSKGISGRAGDSAKAVLPRRVVKPRRSAAPASVPPKPPAVLPREEDSEALRRYETILHPDMPPDSALLALAGLDALLGRLRSAQDSVEADIYRAEASALAGREEQACAIIERALPRATRLQRKRIELWTAQGLCGASD
jgi:eukaryotic-like serine/threonine-protein kinase